MSIERCLQNIGSKKVMTTSLSLFGEILYNSRSSQKYPSFMSLKHLRFFLLWTFPNRDTNEERVRFVALLEGFSECIGSSIPVLVLNEEFMAYHHYIMCSMTSVRIRNQVLQFNEWLNFGVLSIYRIYYYLDVFRQTSYNARLSSDKIFPFYSP